MKILSTTTEYIHPKILLSPPNIWIIKERKLLLLQNPSMQSQQEIERLRMLYLHQTLFWQKGYYCFKKKLLEMLLSAQRYLNYFLSRVSPSLLQLSSLGPFSRSLGREKEPPIPHFWFLSSRGGGNPGSFRPRSPPRELGKASTSSRGRRARKCAQVRRGRSPEAPLSPRLLSGNSDPNSTPLAAFTRP